jgi:Cu/Ag efflux protein CusF
MFNKVRTVTVLFVLLVFGLAVSDLEAKGKGPKLSSLDGTLYMVDTKAGTVTLKDGGGGLTNLKVGRKSKVLRNNRKSTLSGLALGDQVRALYDNSHNAQQLGATGPVVSTVQGGVGNVASSTGVVQIKTGQTAKNAQTSSQTRVVRNGKIVSLKSLTLRDRVTAHLAPGGSLVSRVEGADDAVDLQAEGPEEAEVKGTITAIDTVANTITVTPEEGPEVTVNVTADTLIEVESESEGEGDGEGEGEGDGEVTADSVTINDFTEGLFVEVVYDPVTLNAFRIEVQDEAAEGYAEGPITAIDPLAGTVTIDCYGTPVTVIVNASTEIKRNDETVTLADLQIGDEAMAEYNTVTMIAKEIEVESESGEGEGEGGGEGTD